MSQVLRYGLPTAQRLVCENPICDASANVIAEVSIPIKLDPETGKTSESAEICGCAEHIWQLVKGRAVIKQHQLKVPGQRNTEAKS